MALRINCPACKTTNVVDDDKRGKKVHCKKCEKPIVVPTGKTKLAPANAIQDARKTKLKIPAASRNRNDEEDDAEGDDRPAKKKKANTAKSKGGFPILLVVGGVGVMMFLFLLVAVTAAYFLFIRRSDPVPNDPNLIAKIDDKKIDVAPTAKKEDPKTDSDPVKKIDTEPEAKKKDDAKVEPKKDPEPEPKVNPIPNPMPPPMPDPKKEPEPEPKKKGDPKFIPPPNPIFDELPAEIQQQVRRATVTVQATLASGRRIDGSGAFVDEKGIVVTTAEITGTAIPGWTPTAIQIIINGGEKNERSVAAQLVAVDPFYKLAFLRVAGTDLPKPLEFSKNPAVGIGLKLYVAGPDPTAKPGKASAIRPATTAGEVKFGASNLAFINLFVKTGPASSGGPLVDGEGALVGVMIAGNGMRPTSTAIPVQAVRGILDGRFSEPKFGIPFVSQQLNKPVVPVTIKTLDPLDRFKDVKLEVWSGPPGPRRPFSFEAPIPAVGDGEITTHPVKLLGGQASVDVPYPTVGPGQVVWARPVGVNAAGGSNWGVAVPLSPDMIPVDRRAANLFLNIQGQIERTVSLRTAGTVFGLLPSDPSVKAHTEIEYRADLLEIIAPEPGGASLRGAFGKASMRISIDGKIDTGLVGWEDKFRLIPPTFSIFPNNKPKPKLDRDVPATITEPFRSFMVPHYSAIFGSLEAAMIPLPNRVVQPLEPFAAQIVYMLRAGKQPLFADIDLLCKLEGTRTRNARIEALVSMTGKMKGRDQANRDALGDVTGYFAFDLTGGYLSHVQLDIRSDMEDKQGLVGNTTIISTEVTRIPGNPMNIQMQTDPKKVPDPKVPIPVDPKNPTPKTGKILVSTSGFLIPTGTFNPKTKMPPTGPPKSVKTQGIKMEMGKNYTVMVNTNTFSAQAKIEDAMGRVVQQNDKAAGNNARITFRPMQTGLYYIVISSGKGSGQFQLLVQESP